MSYRNHVDKDRSQVILAMGKGFLSFFPNHLLIDLLYIWLCWVSVAALGLSLVAASGGHSLGAVCELPLQWPLLLQNTALGAEASAAAARGLSSGPRA